MKKFLAIIMMLLLCSGICAVSAEDVQAATGKSTQKTVNEAARGKKKNKSDKSKKSGTSKKDKKNSKAKKNSSKVKQYNQLKSMPSVETYTDPEEVPVWNAQASSWLEDEKDYYKYHPSNLFDHDLSTAYVEGEPDDGIGQMVEFTFGYGMESTTYAITQIEIHPGYQKSQNTFVNNSRPTRLGFYFPDGSVEMVDLGTKYDKDAVITVEIDPIVTNKCTMVIEDAITGKKYKDCCISEVTFYSQEITGMTYYEREAASEGVYDDPKAEYIIDAYAGEAMIWSYQTNNIMTELTSSSYLASGWGKVIVYDEAKIVALDALTGETLWEVEDTGFPGACSFDKEGNLVVCGYYGYVTIIDEDGEVVWKDDPAGEDYSWACMLVLKENREMSIYYAMYEENDGPGKVFTTEY